jgi:tripartite-type tricarboxylate transporter receptor subunit TctC
MKRFAGVAALAAVVMVAAPVAAQAQAYPAKPIRVVVGFPAGTGPDTIIRQIAQKMGELNGWSLVIDNRPGQGSSLAASEAAKAAPDGYTVLFSATAALATNPTLYNNLRYDSEKDFTPVTRIIDLPLVLLVNAGSTYKSLADLIADAKAKPGALNYASIGNGSTSHLVMAMVTKRAGVQMTHVPFKGSAQLIPALLGGDVHAAFESTIVGMTNAKAGKVRMLAVSPAKRVSALSDVPTVAESGLAGFDMAAWYGLLGPAGLPAPVVQRLNQEFIRAVTAPDLRGKLEEQGTPVVTSTPEAFGAYIRSERAKWGQAVRESGAKVD